jgi:sugar-specific transcriptional regulator TrmB
LYEQLYINPRPFTAVTEDPLVADLKAFGLEEMEAQAYVRLARLGKARASSLSSALKINRTTTYRILERLKQAGIVETSMSRPVSFIAVEPKKALQLLIDRRKDELRAAEGRYSSILEQFTKFYVPSEEAVGAKFNILQGNEEIHRAVTRLAKDASKKMSMITSVRDLGKMYYSGAYEAIAAAAARGVKVEILTEVTDLQALDIVAKHYGFAEVRHRAESKMRMVLKDEEEALITVAAGGAEEEVALWTYSQSFASAMQSIATNEFHSGIELGAIATALKTGKPAESFRIITDEKEYTSNMMALLTSAKSELYIGFNLHPTFSTPAVLEVLKSLASRGVKVRVLSAPSSEEADIVRKLHGTIDFRISAFQTDVQVMIADGKEMLFSNAARAQGSKRPDINIRTNLAGMVSFMHNIVADIWLDSREYILELETLQQSILLNRCAGAVRAMMQDHGIEIVLGNKILGKSGVLHKFDIISPSTKAEGGGGRIAVSFLAYSDPESTGTRLMESKIKLLDCEPIDLVIGMLQASNQGGENDGPVAKLARAVGLHIVQAGDPDRLAELVFHEIEGRY